LASFISDTNLLLQRWQVAQFSILHNVHTSSGAHLASYSVGTWQFVPGGKEPGVKAECSSPSSAEVKYMYCNTSTSPYAFILHVTPKEVANKSSTS